MLCLINALPPFVTPLLSIFQSTVGEREQEKLIRRTRRMHAEEAKERVRGTWRWKEEMERERERGSKK